MKPLTNEELAVLAASILASTSFLLSAPSPQTAKWENDWICAVVPFDATVPGRLVVAAPATLAAQVAADVLAVAPSDDDAIVHAGPAVASLASAMADVIVAKIFADAGRFRIGVPAIIPLEPPITEGESANRVTLVNDFGQPLRVELVLGDGVGSELTPASRRGASDIFVA